MLPDFRTALRSLARRPGFALLVMATLAIGIGANTAIFSVLNAVLLRPLPYVESERLVNVHGNYPQGGLSSYSLPDFLDVRARTRSMTAVAGFTTAGGNLATSGLPERVDLAYVTGDFFQVLRVSPALGRTVTRDDERGRPGTVVLSYEAWPGRFEGARDVIGKGVTIDGRPYTVVGVAPRIEAFPQKVDFWIGIRTDSVTQGRRNEFLDVIGRLRPGVTVEQADREVLAIMEQLASEYPQTNRSFRSKVASLQEDVVGRVRPALLVFMGAVGLVLLIACANVANLLLARAVGREREVAIRSAMGASRTRIFRQLLVESVTLALLGGLAGVGLAYVGTRLLRASDVGDIPRLAEVTVDARVLAFAVVVSVATGLLFGLAPALRLSREELQPSLRGSARGSSGTRGERRLRGALVLAEVALAVVLLVGAGLLMRSFEALRRTDPGFSSERVLVARVSLPTSAYDSAYKRRAFWSQLDERLRALPGVEAAGLTSSAPMGGSPYWSVQVEGVQPDPNQMNDAQAFAVTPGFFDAIRVRLVRGRVIGPQDAGDASTVAVINESMAQKFWGRRDPIGTRISFDGTTWLTVVGIVKDTRQEGLAERPYTQAYLPMTQLPRPGMFVTVRTKGDPEALTGAVRRLVAEMDPQLPLYGVTTMEARVARTVAQPRLTARLTAVFAAVALLLAALGIYGVVAYGVAERTREIGVRMALGATRAGVMRLVVGQGMLPVASGIVVGLFFAWACARLIAKLLYGVTPADVLTYVAVVGFLGVVALVAIVLPARRASVIEPTQALRYE